MHFETKEDIDSPIADLFAAITDVEGFERAAIRRGAEVRRNGTHTGPLAELSWDVAFLFRGSQREVALRVAETTPPQALVIAAQGKGMTGTMRVELLALSAQRTRMTVRFDLKPKTLAARLLVQSLKLARGKINRRLRQRVAEFARTTEERLTQGVQAS